MTDDLALPEAPEPSDHADLELLGLIDRLAELLERSDLSELEIHSGETGVILRKPIAIGAVAAPVPSVVGSGSAGGAGGDSASATGVPAAHDQTPAARPSVKALLTGIFYASPAPGTAPYVKAGGEVAIGQVIGLIEAMKLFNEIKSDLAGRVVRVVPDSGALVKAKQPLIEVEPL
jgi:acetyl-CoA carboxylase biotin carboxyl carrier protein